MKVWELEEGKVYVSNLDDGGTTYKIINGDLFYKVRENYMKSYIDYTTVKDVDFTEYEEPVDWSKVEVDTKILVRDDVADGWKKRHFAEVKDGIIHAFHNGRTSFSNDNFMLQPWNYAKLYKETDDEK